MANKHLREIKDDLLRYLAGVQATLDDRVAQEIGDAVVMAMKDMIAKGISPIEGAGRFPAYLAAANVNGLRKRITALGQGSKRRRQTARQLTAQTRSLKWQRVFRSRNSIRAAKANIRAQRAALKAQALESKSQRNALKAGIGGIKSRGYPYSVQDKYPDKRPRPVNLFLSGDFLAALEARVTGSAGGFGLEIGFFDSDQAVKEQGHREQAGGQGFRPIIPIDREEFALTIQRVIIKIVDQVIDRGLDLGSR